MDKLKQIDEAIKDNKKRTANIYSRSLSKTAPDYYFNSRLKQLDLIETALIHLKETVERGEYWQPIDTAPKDGTEIIILQTSGCVQRVKWVEDDTDNFAGWVDFQDETCDWVEKWIVAWTYPSTQSETIKKFMEE